MGYGMHQAKKRICFILRFHPNVAIGGAELQVLRIAEELVKRKWEVHFISEDGGQYQRNEQENGIDLHSLPERKRGRGFANYFHLSRLLKEIAPHVVYQRVAIDYTGIVCILARRHRIKYVWAAASNNDCQKGAHWHLQRSTGNRLKHSVQRLSFTAIEWLISYGVQGSDIAIVQSKDQQQLLKKHYGKESFVVRNGSEIVKVGEKKPSMPSVLWVANIKPWKRLDIFIELAERCTDLPVKFVVIGNDKVKLGEELLKGAQSLDNVEYLGSMDPEKIGKHFDDAYVFVNTSDMGYEGFPNTFIQAWMRKTPVISLNTDPDGVIKKHNLGFHSGSLEEMVQHVRLVISDERLRQRMGEDAYRYATREHDIRLTVNSLEEILECLI
jgi:glycosyltransferase involved in cell wall biosynthesis